MSKSEELYLEQLIKNSHNRIINNIDTKINDLGITMANAFSQMATKTDLDELRKELKAEIATKADKSDIQMVLAHIGRYEIRAQNTHEIVVQDHKPRIIELEKEVFT